MATKHRVHPAWVRRPRQLRKATGETVPGLTRRRSPTKAPNVKAIQAVINETPDPTLAGSRQRLSMTFSVATLHRAIVLSGQAS